MGPRSVCAGPLTALLDGADLRRVMLGKTEVIRRIGFAVRDDTWDTLPPELSRERAEVGADSFQAQFAAHFTSGRVRFTATITLEGDAHGRLIYRFDGRADNAFRYNRIGLVILHPPSLAGRRARLQTDGLDHLAALPQLVEPQWQIEGRPRGMWMPFESMEIDVGPDLVVRHEFTGDRFEMEDQRNWGDASYKTYSTPLSLDWPHEMTKGDRVDQRLVVTLRGHADHPGENPSPTTVIVGRSIPGVVLPRIGFTVDDNVTADNEILDLLRRIRRDHLRTTPDRRPIVEPVARALKADLELVGAGTPAGALHHDQSLRVARRLVVGTEGSPPSPDEFDTHLAEDSSDESPVLIATAGPFVALNRSRPLPTADGVAFALSPQVHDIDDRTILENLEAITAMVDTARLLGGGPHIAVGPITLRPAQPDPSGGLGATRSPADPRQDTPLSLAWTLGMLAALACSGVDATTWCTLAGPAGLVERTETGKLTVRPAFWLFEHLKDWRNAQVLHVQAQPTSPMATLALAQGNRIRIFVGNLTDTPQPVRVELPAETSDVMIRTADSATSRPPVDTRSLGQWSGQLDQYQVVVIDCRRN